MTRTCRWTIGLQIAGFCLSGALLLPMGAAQAQYDQSQLVRPLGAADLNSNLARLASDPRDVNALIGAGEAALSLDDARAAAGFFARADAIASGNGRIKAGLGRVMLKLQNPVEALRLFDQAARLGYPDATILSDRGLARDMTGDQAGAQRDYQVALQRTPNDDELVRRYAASLGIAGQIAASDKVMEPLFYKSDRAAWRYRAFILAMNNKQAEAKKVAEQTMPAQLAAAITPYMQKMPYLTAAQKAAAVHFGHFPAQIGTTIAAVTPTPPAPGVAVASAAPATVASAAPARTKPLSRSEQRRQQREAARAARAERLAAARRPAQSQSAPVRTATAQPAPTQPAPVQMAQATPPQAAMVQPTPRPTVTQPSRQPQSQPTPQPRPTPPAAQVQPLPAAPSVPTAAPQSQPSAPSTTAPSTAVQGPPAPGFESIDRTPPSTPSSSAGSPPNGIALAQSTTPAASPSPTPTAATTQPLPSAPPQPDPAATRSLADIIRAIDVPDTERQPTVAAVDLSEIAAIQATRRAERQTAAKAAADKAKKDAIAKAKVEADAKAKKEAEEKKRLADNPSRNWLQIGVGQSKSALGFTMKGLRKKYTILSRQDGWSASWGRTNRLLVGPFASFTRAKELETSLKKDGADAFAWKSGAGEVVEKLGE